MATENLAIRRAARRAGLSAGYVSRVLSGRRNPKLETASAIARAMGITIDRLHRIIDANRRGRVSSEACDNG